MVLHGNNHKSLHTKYSMIVIYSTERENLTEKTAATKLAELTKVWVKTKLIISSQWSDMEITTYLFTLSTVW